MFQLVYNVKLKSSQSLFVAGGLLCFPQPLVGFVGLGPDDEGQRRRLWETFTSNRGPDRFKLPSSASLILSLQIFNP